MGRNRHIVVCNLVIRYVRSYISTVRYTNCLFHFSEVVIHTHTLIQRKVYISKLSHHKSQVVNRRLALLELVVMKYIPLRYCLGQHR